MENHKGERLLFFSKPKFLFYVILKNFCFKRWTFTINLGFYI